MKDMGEANGFCQVKTDILRIWSDSIAEAAKEGDHAQDKLDWDSYGKIRSDMISAFLWNKEKERIMKKLKRAVTKIIAKKLQAAEKREVEARRTKKAKTDKLVLQKPDARPRRVVASTRSKLKERLTKVLLYMHRQLVCHHKSLPPL